MKRTLIAAAAAALCVSANALYVDFGDAPEGGDPSGGVVVIGNRQVFVWMQDSATVDNNKPVPIPRRPSDGSAMPGIPPSAPPPKDGDEWRKRREQCLNDCSTKFQISNNQCLEVVADMRYQMAARPYLAAAGGAIAGAIATRTFLGLLAGAPMAWMYTTQVVDRQIADVSAQCAGAAAGEYNGCIQGTCGAWILAPLALLRRRREPEA